MKIAQKQNAISAMLYIIGVIRVSIAINSVAAIFIFSANIPFINMNGEIMADM